jgi:hypothetical protein
VVRDRRKTKEVVGVVIAKGEARVQVDSRQWFVVRDRRKTKEVVGVVIAKGE